jgi:hypothetical protein
LPSPIAADCFTFGLRFKREIDDVDLLTHHDESHTLRAATGPSYGRIWNADVVAQLVKRFGDGVTGQWKVPGEFGRDVEITKANTTLYAGDRDMFVFLADERNRIEVPNRRGGKVFVADAARAGRHVECLHHLHHRGDRGGARQEAPGRSRRVPGEAVQQGHGGATEGDLSIGAEL